MTIVLKNKQTLLFDDFIFKCSIGKKGFTKKIKVTPKQGRVVLFDGALYHTAQQPNNNIRCVVNYDLKDLSVDSHI